MKPLGLLLLLLASKAAIAQSTPASRAALDQVVRDYASLYRAETLAEWKELFHARLTVASPGAGDAIVVRDLEQFYGAQASYLQQNSVSERLENVRIEEGRRIARVVADFVLVDDGVESRGKLGLHLVESRRVWKIVGIVFSYDVDAP